MKYFILIISLLSLFFQALGQSSMYSEVKIILNSVEEIQELVQKGYAIDHYQGNWKDGIRFFVTPSELQALQNEKYALEITIPNYKEYYNTLQQTDRNKNPNPVKSENVAAGFDLGSMGGFYTYDEVVSKLDEMRTKYPNLITAKNSIGVTEENRDIWMVKISDNPDVDEPEPTAHFDALHHAREPLSMATTINYMFWLLENYETNTSVKFLVDNREIYFVPVVNPDGYVYNETTNPDGGGLWRKNRSQTIVGCFGVDLNRNYGFGYATDDSCSSSNPCSEIYRGFAAFSEPETKAIRDVLALTQPKTAFSTHSTAGTYLMPYGFDTSPPAFDIYSEWASAFLDENEYSYGVTFQMLGYTSCGTTRDYMHSEAMYGWTPEIGGNGFWPPESTIFDLVAENVRPFMFQTYIAGAYLDVQSYEILGTVAPGESFELVVEVKNIGVGATANNVSVVVQTDATGVLSPTANSFGNIPVRQKKDNAAMPFQFSLDPQFEGGAFTITVTTIQDGIPNETLEIPVFVGEKELIFKDNAESGAANWTASGTGINWSINTDDSFSGAQCFGDSSNANSENNTENYFQLNETFNLIGLEGPLVQFAYKHSLVGVDSVSFQISTNNGVDWFSLRTYQENEDWTVASINLSGFSEAESVQFRFAMVTDGARPGDGFYFDDFQISNFTGGILAVSDSSKNAEILVFPNPFSETITIQHSRLQNFSEIQLFDIQGKKLNITVSEETIQTTITNVATLQAGIYFLMLRDAATGKSRIKRVLKN
ncbi:M14 family zinc carboxypeptidase [Rasiella sp. SM2506]|uniref:M14 family zinc carboxypeptidase n=1 Tax=Rasiella sp. SM2506 TaxID=3423914 RepID=UPI003D78EE5F